LPIVFTPEQRARLLDELVAAAEQDPRITAAALTGSAALGREDEWSDIDLALRLAPDADATAVVDDWTARMAERGTVDTLDIRVGGTLFRVFLLADTLQVDLSFWPDAEFGATGPKFTLLFGAATEQEHVRPPSPAGLIGMGWLYALHARSSIARGRVWQAEYMISGMRDQVLALACLRHDVSTVQARGIDEVPTTVTGAFTPTLVRSLDVAELARAFAATAEALLTESGSFDPQLSRRLAGPLREMVAASAQR
jgi:predicted nucleotidyltransferase